jgi:hypothetical protein
LPSKFGRIEIKSIFAQNNLLNKGQCTGHLNWHPT